MAFHNTLGDSTGADRFTESSPRTFSSPRMFDADRRIKVIFLSVRRDQCVELGAQHAGLLGSLRNFLPRGAEHGTGRGLVLTRQHATAPRRSAVGF
jgi:hypothetical protein